MLIAIQPLPMRQRPRQLSTVPKKPISKWNRRLRVAAFFVLIAALIYGPLALAIGATRDKWQPEELTRPCTEQARTLAALRLSIEAEREGVIACIRDDSSCLGVYSEPSLRAQQAREARLRRSYLEQCSTGPQAAGISRSDEQS